jgi:hypothetical protein
MFTAKYTAPLSKKYPLKIVLSQPAWMIQALARERRPRGKSPAQHGAVAAAPFFLTFRRQLRNGGPQKYARYKNVLWQRSR